MRIKLKDDGPLYSFKERTITYFAFLPVRIRSEIRWFEMVTIKQWYFGGDWQNGEFLNA